jgi:hypothetical protein
MTDTMSTAPQPRPHAGLKCGARNHQNGKLCTLPAGWGTAHVGTGNCRKHGGNTPNAQINARRLQAEEACRRFGVEVETTPEQALLRELACAVGETEFYRERVRELPREMMTYGVERHQFAHAGAEPADGDLNKTIMHTRPSVWIVLLQQSERQLHELAATMIKLGIEARALDLAEQQGAALYRVVINIVGDLGMADDPRLSEILPRRFRELTA